MFSLHPIGPGDLFDTDFIGPFGYCANISRTFQCSLGYCSPGKPSIVYAEDWEAVGYDGEIGSA